MAEVITEPPPSVVQGADALQAGCRISGTPVCSHTPTLVAGTTTEAEQGEKIMFECRFVAHMCSRVTCRVLRQTSGRVVGGRVNYLRAPKACIGDAVQKRQQRLCFGSASTANRPGHGSASG
eukprot:802890-Prorocentrum_minimum.AAC.1